ncbi:hypothetical protein SB775_27220 [Peribacillus sp. SIMBA_075]|uniref:hypothetical protein n=1 Tax=Peribacillus sp. SIMBA_075 TaxID=3085813 RepID=UPI00397E8F15
MLSQRAKKRSTIVSPARAVPQASAPFHSVSSFIVVDDFFDLFNIDSGSVSDLIVFVSLDRGATIVRLNPSISIYVSVAASQKAISPLAGNSYRSSSD